MAGEDLRRHRRKGYTGRPLVEGPQPTAQGLWSWGERGKGEPQAPVTGSEEEPMERDVSGGSRIPWCQGQSCSRMGSSQARGHRDATPSSAHRGG